MNPRSFIFLVSRPTAAGCASPFNGLAVEMGTAQLGFKETILLFAVHVFRLAEPAARAPDAAASSTPVSRVSRSASTRPVP
jgi:hypothetical protein